MCLPCCALKTWDFESSLYILFGGFKCYSTDVAFLGGWVQIRGLYLDLIWAECEIVYFVIIEKYMELHLTELI